MSDPPPLSVGHRCRNSVLDPEYLWELRGDSLWCSSGPGELEIPLREISAVRLVFAPTRMQLKRYRCLIYSGRLCRATIQNEHYKGFASFEDRSESYRELVIALIHRLAGVNPDCKLWAGPSAASFSFQCAILFVSLGLLAFLLVWIGSSISGLVIVKLVLVACLLPTTILWILRNRPRTLARGTVPPALLPKKKRSAISPSESPSSQS